MKRITFLIFCLFAISGQMFADSRMLDVVEDDCVREDGKAQPSGKMMVYNNNGSNIDTYLKFDLSNFSSIDEATLKLTIGGYSASGLNAKWTVELSENNWTEALLTWANRPATIGVLTTLGPNIGGITATTASWMESSTVKIPLEIPLPVAALQQRLTDGTPLITLHITMPAAVSGGGEINIASKESAGDASINRPDLAGCAPKLLVTGTPLTKPTTLGSLTIDGDPAPGFSAGKTDYRIILPAGTTDYPPIVATPADGDAVVGPITYLPETFDPQGENLASFTVTNDSKTAEYNLTFVVDIMETLCNLYMERIRENNMTSRSAADIDNTVDNALAVWQSTGRFSDINYSDRNGRDKEWESLTHVARMRDFAFAYTMPGSKYYENDDLYSKLVTSLGSWVNNHPATCENWWFNWIPEPQYLGVMLIQMRIGKQKIDPALETKVTSYMSANGGTPGVSPAYSAANRMDVAVHWFYRACLTKNETVLETAMTQYYIDFRYVAPTAEGLQADGGFFQHGTQFYIGGYGDVFISGALLLAGYTAGTKYALNKEQTELLSKFVRESFYGTVRGNVQSWSIGGRGYLSRPNSIRKSAAYARQFIPIDPENTEEYRHIIDRTTGAEPPSFAITPANRQFYIGDYALHTRPAYLFDVRMASTRTVRIEYGNYENLRTFFAADGCTNILRTGNEYLNIFPMWNWARIPGITCPQVPNDKIPLSSSDMSQRGISTFAGGVTDSVYGITAYSYGGAHTGNSAKKGWFFFDNEVVCLGNDITSVIPSNSYVRQNDYDGRYFNSANWMTSLDQYEINTTVNQCYLKGDVTVSSAGNTSVLTTQGDHSWPTAPDWALHDSIGYFFPLGGNVGISNKKQTGSWYDINRSNSSDPLENDVFTLWFNHGKPAEREKYAYIVVPDIASAEDMDAYKAASPVEILANNDSVQAVYHKELKIYGLIFFRAASFLSGDLTVEAGSGCVMLLKDVDKDELTAFVSDPQRQASPVKIGIKTPRLNETKTISYQNPASPHQGKSLEFTVNNNTPGYAGKDVLLERDEWTIVASSTGPVDNTVAPLGDNPEYIIDGDTHTAFLFVKPGKNYGGISVPSDTKPSFTIDLKNAFEMTYLLYRHRDYSNTTTYLRASKASFYGKNAETDEFQPIIKNFGMATDVAEVRVDFPEKVSYRYVKFVFEEWDTANGSTIQTSEFNLGNTLLSNETGIDHPLAESSDSRPVLYPNPVKAGQPIYIRFNDAPSDASATVYTLTGVKLSDQKLKAGRIELSPLTEQGIYIIEVRKNGREFILKATVN